MRVTRGDSHTGVPSSTLCTSGAHSTQAGGKGFKAQGIDSDRLQPLNVAQRSSLSTGSHGYRIIKHLASPEGSAPPPSTQAPGAVDRGQQAPPAHMWVSTHTNVAIAALRSVLKALGTLKIVTCPEGEKFRMPGTSWLGKPLGYPDVLMFLFLFFFCFNHSFCCIKTNRLAESIQNTDTTAFSWCSLQRLTSPYQQPLKPGSQSHKIPRPPFPVTAGAMQLRASVPRQECRPNVALSSNLSFNSL